MRTGLFSHASGFWRRGLAFLLVLSMIPVGASAGEILTLSGRLLRPDGQPAPDVKVCLVGVDRNNVGNLLGRPTPAKYLRQTNERGEFSFIFKRVDAKSVSGKSNKDEAVGVGEYYLVAGPAKGYAGAMSPRIVNCLANNPFPFNREMGFDFLELNNDLTTITLQLRRGIFVIGRVVNPEMKGLANQTVTLYHGLHADRQIKPGSEFLGYQVRTNPQGEFCFINIYPATFWLRVTPATGWTRTRVGENGTWVDDRIDEIKVEPNQKRVQVEIVSSVDPRFKVFGTVRDGAGHPVANAEVTANLMYHRQRKDYGDYHANRVGKTDAQGRYEIPLETPWLQLICAIRINDTDMRSLVEISDKGKIMPPGRYDFTLPSE